MSSRPLSLVSAGHQARQREINHSRGDKPAGSGKSNRNGNSNRKPPKVNWNNRQNNGKQAVPFPSAGKGSRDLLNDAPLISGSKQLRGNNLNHLLSFQSYETQPHSNNRSPRYSKNSGKRTFRSKEEFLQSTAQFLVRSDSELELAPFGVDSDIPVPWKFIEAVRLFGQEATECPICLHPPVAGKVGRCGHAHCASCVLKLIAISEYPECPICQCHIKIQDLRSVFHQVEPRPKNNSVVKFIKMQRKKASVVSKAIGHVPEFWLDRYERVVSLSDATILEKIIEKEEIELACQEADCEESEKPFIAQAKEMLSTRRGALKVEKPQKSAEKNPDETKVSTDVSKPEQENTKPKETDVLAISNPNLEPEYPVSEPLASEKPASPAPKPEDDSYYYYQTSDCGNMFLSAINAKCLITQYGSLKDAPDSFSAKMLEIDDYTMDQDVRKRFRYLSHLSLGEPFSLIYVDHDGLGLSPETYDKHRSQIQNKRKLLKKKDREENKAAKKNEEYYDRELYGKYTPANISLSSHEMFPNFEIEDSPTITEEIQAQSPSSPIPIAQPGTSGAWAAKSLSPIGQDWPAASPELPKSKSGASFWGEMKKSSKAPESKSLEILDDEDDIGEELKAPDFRRGFAADLYSAIEEAATTKKTEKSPEEKKPKKAQKKKKGRVIFST